VGGYPGSGSGSRSKGIQAFVPSGCPEIITKSSSSRHLHGLDALGVGCARYLGRLFLDRSSRQALVPFRVRKRAACLLSDVEFAVIIALLVRVILLIDTAPSPSIPLFQLDLARLTPPFAKPDQAKCQCKDQNGHPDTRADELSGSEPLFVAFQVISALSA
jgi:hypothetical protein